MPRETEVSGSEIRERDWLAKHVVGASPAMRAVRARILELARTPDPVLVLGERGSGRDRVVRVLHALGSLAGRPLIVVRPRALRRQRCRRPAPRGACVYLDGVDHLTPEEWAYWGEQWGRDPANRRLARVYASRERSGASLALAGGAQFGSARALEAAFQRAHVPLPALRERVCDIPEIAARLLPQWAARLGTRVAYPEPAALRRLIDYPWPGDLLEFEATLIECLAGAGGGVIRLAQVEARLADHEGGRPAQFAVVRAELLAALRACGGNLAASARRLGLSRSTLVERLRRHGIDASL